MFYLKSMKKTINIIALILNTILLAFTILWIILRYTEAEVGAIGVIGGADGPTAINLSIIVDKVFDILRLIILTIFSFFEFVFITNIRKEN